MSVEIPIDHSPAVTDTKKLFTIKGPRISKYANYLYAKNVPNILRFRVLKNIHPTGMISD